MQSEGTCLQTTFAHLLAQEFIQEFVLVVFVCTYIYDKMQFVGHDVVLSSSLNDGYRQFRWSQQRTLFTELIVAKPYQIVEGLIDGIYTFISCGMSTDTVGIAVR